MADLDAVFFTGWEIPFTAHLSSLPSYDVTRARTGKGYLKHKVINPASGQGNGTTFKALNNMGSSFSAGTPTIVDNGKGGFHARVYFRINELPGGGPFCLWNYDMTHIVGAGLKADGTWFVFNSAMNNNQPASAATETASATVLATGVWHLMEFEWTVSLKAGTCSAVSQAGCDILYTRTRINGEALSLSAQYVRTTSTSQAQTGATRLADVPGSYLNSSFTAGGVTGVHDIDFDDWVARLHIRDTSTDYAHSIDTLPEHDRVVACSMTGLGTNSAWTNGSDYKNGARFIRGADTGTLMTQVGAGANQDFTHQSLAEITGDLNTAGDVICEVGGISLYHYGYISANSHNPIFRIGGVNTTAYGRIDIGSSLLPTGVSNWTALPHYSDFTVRDEATFDALEIGMQSVGTTETNSVAGIGMEVLVNMEDANTPYESGNTAAKLNSPFSARGFKMEWYQWDGTGATTPQTLAGFGRWPHFVMVWELEDSAIPSVDPWFKTIDMPGNVCMGMDQRPYGEAIIRFTTDGFIYGPTLNVSGRRYIALVIRDDGNAVGGRIFACGSFRQNTTTPPAVRHSYSTTFGSATHPQTWVPEILFIVPGWRSTTGGGSFWKTSALATGETYTIELSSNQANAISTLDTDGFTMGTNANFPLGQDNYWFGFANTDEVANRISAGKEEGTAANLVVDPVSEQPPYMVVARGVNDAFSLSAALRMRHDDAIYIDTRCAEFTGGSTIDEANAILSFDTALNTFTLGGNNTTFNDDAPASIDPVWMFFSTGFEIEPIGWAPEPPTPFPPDEDLIGDTVGLIWFELYLPE